MLTHSVSVMVIQAQAAQPAQAAEPDPSELDELTARELQVVRQIARGRSNAELAQELTISETTVKTHVARILAKLRLRDRVQIVVFAYEHGLVEPRQQRP